MPDSREHRRAASVEPRVHLGGPRRAVLDADVPSRSRSSTSSASSSCPTLFDADTGRARSRRRDRRVRAPRSEAFLASRDDGAALDRGDRRHHVLDPPGHAVAAAARLQRATRLFVGICARPHRARRQPLLGPGRLQEAREAAPVPVAPGQRLRVRRTAAVPHDLGRAHRRDRGQRLPGGRAGATTGGARSPTPTSSRWAGSACTIPTRRSWPRSPAGGRGRVLVAHAAPHRPEHDRRGAQGVHPPVRPGGGHDPARRPRRPRPPERAAADDPDRQFPVVRGGRPVSR